VSDSEYVWLNKTSQAFLEKDYLLPGQTVDQRITEIATSAEKILNKPGFAEKFKSYMKKGWFSLSTPIWVNFGAAKRGLPISCFGSYVDDSIKSILTTHTEVGMMTKNGGGTSGTFHNVRGRGEPITNNGESSGSVHFLALFDMLIATISQGSTRRGQFAGYLPIDHKDIMEFLTIRSEGSKIQNLSSGVVISDKWMQEMIDGDVLKREVWAKVLTSRMNTGYPYLFFIDNANNGAPECYKEQNMRIYHSNLCTEIMLPNNESESFVCDLSSMNIIYFDEWCNTDAVEVMVYFLDAVMTEFIEKAKNEFGMERAVKFAERHRALGIGWIGWHSFLQSKMIAFESMEAKLLNIKIAKTIKEQAYAASEKMAQEYGKPEVLQNYNRRHTTLLAIAPTKSSSTILGQASEGIEPAKSNYIIKDLQKIKFSMKNKYLEKVLEKYGKNDDETWQLILSNGGSVQKLDFLTAEEKDVFKTLREISQKELVIQAAGRQRYIDQGQSLNLLVHPSTPVKDVNALIIEAWKLGIKSLYYQYNVNAAQELSRNLLACKSCEG
jgi:ribonucleoside-diphosphate reductase alpha chain